MNSDRPVRHLGVKPAAEKRAILPVNAAAGDSFGREGC